MTFPTCPINPGTVFYGQTVPCFCTPASFFGGPFATFKTLFPSLSDHDQLIPVPSLRCLFRHFPALLFESFSSEQPLATTSATPPSDPPLYPVTAISRPLFELLFPVAVYLVSTFLPANPWKYACTPCFMILFPLFSCPECPRFFFLLSPPPLFFISEVLCLSHHYPSDVDSHLLLKLYFLFPPPPEYRLANAPCRVFCNYIGLSFFWPGIPFFRSPFLGRPLLRYLIKSGDRW